MHPKNPRLTISHYEYQMCKNKVGNGNGNNEPSVDIQRSDTVIMRLQSSNNTSIQNRVTARRSQEVAGKTGMETVTCR